MGVSLSGGVPASGCGKGVSCRAGWPAPLDYALAGRAGSVLTAAGVAGHQATTGWRKRPAARATARGTGRQAGVHWGVRGNGRGGAGGGPLTRGGL